MTAQDKQAILDAISTAIDQTTSDPKYTCAIDGTKMPLAMEVFTRDPLDPTTWHAGQIVTDATGWTEVRDMATGATQLLCPTCTAAGKQALGDTKP